MQACGKDTCVEKKEGEYRAGLLKPAGGVARSRHYMVMLRAYITMQWHGTLITRDPLARNLLGGGILATGRSFDAEVARRKCPPSKYSRVVNPSFPTLLLLKKKKNCG